MLVRTPASILLSKYPSMLWSTCPGILSSTLQVAPRCILPVYFTRVYIHTLDGSQCTSEYTSQCTCEPPELYCQACSQVHSQVDISISEFIDALSLHFSTFQVDTRASLYIRSFRLQKHGLRAKNHCTFKAACWVLKILKIGDQHKMRHANLHNSGTKL